MLDSEIEKKHDFLCDFEIKKESSYSLETPKEDFELFNNDILSDPLFILNEDEQIHSGIGNDFASFKEHLEQSFQNLTSGESSVVSYADQISPEVVDIDHKILNQGYRTHMDYNDSGYEYSPMSVQPMYSGYGNMAPIILQPVMQGFSPIGMPGSENYFNYPLISTSQNFMKFSQDAIVYVPTPVRSIQSNFFNFNNIPNDDRECLNETTSSNIRGYRMSMKNSPSWQMNPGMVSENFELNLDEIRDPFSNSKEFNRTKKVPQLEKTFCCSTCSVKFTRRDELRRHEKIHSGEKPLSCPFCDKCFIRSDHRKTHIRTHTGEKPYACDICSKRFARSDEKLRHTKTHFKDRPRRRRRRKLNDGLFKPDEQMLNVQDKTLPYSTLDINFNTTEQFPFDTPIDNSFSNELQYSPSLSGRMWNT